MRICAVSDTHRYRHELLTAVKNTHSLDLIMHAGDETSDAQWLMGRISWPIYGVAGNWDTANAVFPLERTFDFGPRVFLTHGHRLRVKDNLLLLAERARILDAQIVIYGHTHMANATMLDGMLFVNPGSLAAPRGRRERTYAVIDIWENTDRFSVRVTHCQSNGQTVSGLTMATEFPKYQK